MDVQGPSLGLGVVVNSGFFHLPHNTFLADKHLFFPPAFSQPFFLLARLWDLVSETCVMKEVSFHQKKKTQGHGAYSYIIHSFNSHLHVMRNENTHNHLQKSMCFSSTFPIKPWKRSTYYLARNIQYGSTYRHVIFYFPQTACFSSSVQTTQYVCKKINATHKEVKALDFFFASAGN